MPAIRSGTESRVQYSGAKLRAAREEAGWTREELSVVCDRSAGTIAHYEAGRYRLPLMVARSFAAALKIPLSDLEEDRRPRRVRQ
jgi:transcriptional regulator with XRE-family HTH domain